MPTFSPYTSQVRPPVRVGVLTDIGLVIDEDGNQLHPGFFHEARPDLRVYASVETAAKLVSEGMGEALAWNGSPKRWRMEVRDEEQWRPRPSDVGIVTNPGFPDDVKIALRALGVWRDWLESYGARPMLSLGGSSMSLLRATLRRPFRTMAGTPPPFTWTMGPRQELPLYVNPGSTWLRATHVDLPAAYPLAMADLPYGTATWRRLGAGQLARISFDERNLYTPLVLRAQVQLPEGLVHGPLADRPIGIENVPHTSPERCELLDGTAVARFPTRGELEGTWSWDELAVAVELGADLRVIEGWALSNDGTQPFWPWWEAVQEGRFLHRFAGALAKGTANACWGSFVPSEGKRRLVRGDSSRTLPPLPMRPPSYDLAELITARVRGKAARMMHEVGEKLISFHTDGAWLAQGAPAPDGWKLKARASRLDMQGPQEFRYWPRGKPHAVYTVAGVPRELAEAEFRSTWRGERER